jgi:hypothetical protein
MNHRKLTLALAAVTAIAAPAAATAKPGNGHGPKKGVAYVFKGTYAGAGVVSVAKGNAHVRKADLAGTDVTFDLSAAKLSVADTNGDSAVTADDVVVGDRVVVKAKLPKGDPGEGPYAARHLVDQTHPVEDGAP